REQQKLAKAQLLEEPKEKRERNVAKKAAAREEKKIARHIEKQLQNNLRASKKASKQVPKPSKATKAIVVDESPAIAEEAVYATSRRGRPIRPPKKLMT
ncbi:hypothetical protein P154DRAFT_420732, partial [Amniculicola lignicola CBS 123094]